MIVVAGRMGWLRLMLRLRGTVTPQITLRVLAYTVLACLITWLHFRWGWFSLVVPPLPFTVLGLALSIFLGFRNSTSYDRFWEGRRLWGQLVNTSRNLGRRLLTLPRTEDPAETEALGQWRYDTIQLLIAYAHSLRCHLRGDEDQDLVRLLSPADFARLRQWSHPPLYLAQRLGESIAIAAHRGWIDPLQLTLLEEPLNQLVEIQGSCERIQSTPIPLAYLVLLHQLVAIYCLALPFALVEALDIYTPMVVLLVAYAFLGLDAIGDACENPFELEPHDLPLSALCRTIELNLRCQRGDAELPPLMKPDRDGVLL